MVENKGMQPPVDKLKTLIGGCFFVFMLRFDCHRKIIVGGKL